MRILFCNKYNRPFSGTEIYLFELMELLRSRGHEIALFSMANEGESPSLYQTPFVPFKTTNTWEKIRLAGHALYSTDVRRRLRRAVMEFQPDVAHIRNIYHHLSPSILWELHSQRVPILYHINDFKLICPSYNLVSRSRICNRCQGRRFWHVVGERCYGPSVAASLVLAAEGYFHKWLRTYETCVTKFLTPSHFARQKLIESGWDPARIDVLHHFQVPLEHVASPPNQSDGILYFGRLSQEKGLISVLMAMRNLPSIRLRIAGEGPQAEDLRVMVRALHLENVEFLGNLSRTKLHEALAASRFTVFPSLAYETMGKAILESYACGRAVVATDLGPRRELVIPAKTGLLYAAGDSEQLAAAIHLLYSQPQLAKQMGESARDFVRQHHTPGRHYEKLLAIYKQLAGTVPPRQRTGRKDRHLRLAFIGGRGVIGTYSGIESYYEEVGKRLAGMGHQITVYCRSYFTPKASTHNGMRILRLPCIRTKHLETFSHTLLSTLHAMFGPYDIVHFHTLGPALCSFLPRLTGKKTFVTVQGVDWRRKKWGKLARLVLQLGELAAVRLPDHTTVVSRTLQHYCQLKHGVMPSYIPNGAEIHEPSPLKHLREWNLEPGRYVLFMGRFSPEKNCDLLIRAFESLETDAKLVLAGGAGYSDAYVQDLCRKQSERIRLLSWISGEGRDELLTNAMLFVMPSDLEGLSLALLEAMGAGICVLTSDVPENLELVEGAGFTFRQGNEQDLSRMLQLLISDHELRKQAGHRCQQRIRESYLWPDIARQIELEYLRVLGWKRNAPHAKQTSARAA
jgi:glycosyltransferase involved in cell wall biosynthesis